MKRYNVPRLAFVNKLDRQGSNPWKVIQDLRNDLKLNASAVQIPIGLDGEHDGVVDLIEEKAFFFHGDRGDEVKIVDVPDDLMDLMEEKKMELVEKLADVDGKKTLQLVVSNTYLHHFSFFYVFNLFILSMAQQ